MNDIIFLNERYKNVKIDLNIIFNIIKDDYIGSSRISS